jgi:hypothetical protein
MFPMENRNMFSLDNRAKNRFQSILIGMVFIILGFSMENRFLISMENRKTFSLEN